MDLASIAVVGASLAGVHAAATLRHEGFDGDLVVLDAQHHAPYDRPPLSKQVLRGEWGAERIGLRAAEDLDVRWLRGARATGLDLGPPHRLYVEGGGVLDAEGVVLACGAAPRHLPGTEGLGGVQVLRTLDDALALRAAVDGGARRVLVVGAGFIGGEVAASCRQLDLDVTLVELAEVPLEVAVGAEVGRRVAEVHRQHGVDVRLGTGVDGFDADDAGHVRSARLGDGTEVPVDLVVVGIGVAPDVGWLEGSGLTLDDGVVCDDTLLAAPGVVAAGDVARYRSRRHGGLLRVEHWEHAIAAGEAAARRLLEAGRHEPVAAAVPADAPGTDDGLPVFDPLPYFWSDQYDRKIQLAGVAGADHDMVVVHGDLAEGRFVAVYGQEGRATAVLGMNRPRHVMQLRGLVESSAPFDEVVAAGRAL